MNRGIQRARMVLDNGKVGRRNAKELVVNDMLTDSEFLLISKG